MNFYKEVNPITNWALKSPILETPYLILLFGGADVFSGGKSETLTDIENSLIDFVSNNDYPVSVHSFNIPLPFTLKPIKEAYSYIKDYNEAKIIVYGYSFGGFYANALCRLGKVKKVKIETLFTVDAATGLVGDLALENDNLIIPENVKLNINYYQTDKNILASRGYPHKAKNSNKTNIVNLNYDAYKSENGLGAHRAMDEDTKPIIIEKIKFDLDKFYLF